MVVSVVEVLPAVNVVKLWTVSRVVTVEQAGTEVEVVEIVTIVPNVKVVVEVTVRQKSHFCYTNANHSDSADSLQCQSSGKQVG